jgi:hypothetical protein
MVFAEIDVEVVNVAVDVFLAFDFVQGVRSLEFNGKDMTSGFGGIRFAKNRGEVLVELGQCLHVFDDGTRYMLVILVIHDDSWSVAVPNSPQQAFQMLHHRDVDFGAHSSIGTKNSFNTGRMVMGLLTMGLVATLELLGGTVGSRAAALAAVTSSMGSGSAMVETRKRGAARYPNSHAIILAFPISETQNYESV